MEDSLPSAGANGRNSFQGVSHQASRSSHPQGTWHGLVGESAAREARGIASLSMRPATADTSLGGSVQEDTVKRILTLSHSLSTTVGFLDVEGNTNVFQLTNSGSLALYIDGRLCLQDVTGCRFSGPGERQLYLRGSSARDVATTTMAEKQREVSQQLVELFERRGMQRNVAEFVDTDGDSNAFRLSSDGLLALYVNGQLCERDVAQLSLGGMQSRVLQFKGLTSGKISQTVVQQGQQEVAQCVAGLYLLRGPKAGSMPVASMSLVASALPSAEGGGAPVLCRELADRVSISGCSTRSSSYGGLHLLPSRGHGHGTPSVSSGSDSMPPQLSVGSGPGHGTPSVSSGSDSTPPRLGAGGGAGHGTPSVSSASDSTPPRLGAAGGAGAARQQRAASLSLTESERRHLARDSSRETIAGAGSRVTAAGLTAGAAAAAAAAWAAPQAEAEATLLASCSSAGYPEPSALSRSLSSTGGACGGAAASSRPPTAVPGLELRESRPRSPVSGTAARPSRQSAPSAPKAAGPRQKMRLTQELVLRLTESAGAQHQALVEATEGSPVPSPRTMRARRGERQRQGSNAEYEASAGHMSGIYERSECSSSCLDDTRRSCVSSSSFAGSQATSRASLYESSGALAGAGGFSRACSVSSRRSAASMGSRQSHTSGNVRQWLLRS